MKRILASVLCMMAFATPSFAADNDITIRLNGSSLLTEEPPFVENGRTLVPLKAVCQAMGLQVVWNGETRGITISNREDEVSLCIDTDIININGEDEKLDAPPKIIDGVSWIPIRAVVEPFGAVVDWDGENRVVIIEFSDKASSVDKPITGGGDTYTPPISDSKPVDQPTISPSAPPLPETEDTPSDNTQTPLPDTDEKADTDELPDVSSGQFTFYAQADEELSLENNGRGFCWVCSYAMLITDLTGEGVLPQNIADFNLNAGSSSGNYMANHFNLAKEYGLKFVSAISEDSEYFDRFDSSHRGATYFKTETDEDVKNALIEALERNPKGIMVRFEGYPHTLIATEYKDGEIYFNDPGKLDTENVTFENTVLGKRFSLSDLTFVQALAVK